MTQPLPMQLAQATVPINKPAWLPTLLSVVRAYQAFEGMSNTHIEKLGLTPAQFDVIVTLGNTNGLTCREVGERTLITKGTLTGVLDRLEKKAYLKRIVSDDDRRSFTVKLTRKGEECFAAVFPAQLTHMDQFFGKMSAEELQAIENSLARFRAVLADTPTAQT